MTDDLWDLTNSVDLGKDHRYDFIYGDEFWWKDIWPPRRNSLITRRNPEAGNPTILVGASIFHWCKNKILVGSLIHFTDYIENKRNYPIWKVKKFSNLSIEPFISCKHCFDQGMITEGKWLPL